MKIEILGMGCPKCEKLYENARTAVKEANAQAEVVKVKDIQKITDYGIMATPAIAIDGGVRAAGRVPPSEEIKKWLEAK